MSLTLPTTAQLIARNAAALDARQPRVVELYHRDGGVMVSRVGGSQTCLLKPAHVVRCLSDCEGREQRNDRPDGRRLFYPIHRIGVPAWMLAKLRAAGVID